MQSKRLRGSLLLHFDSSLLPIRRGEHRSSSFCFTCSNTRTCNARPCVSTPRAPLSKGSWHGEAVTERFVLPPPPLGSPFQGELAAKPTERFVLHRSPLLAPLPKESWHGEAVTERFPTSSLLTLQSYLFVGVSIARPLSASLAPTRGRAMYAPASAPQGFPFPRGAGTAKP